MQDRHTGRRARERARDLRRDRPTILGGLALATGVLAVLAGTLALAWWLGPAQTWPVAGWLAISALAGILLSLEVLFVRDYRRWRRIGAAPRRG
ncbi:MAG: hypothetical protein ACRDI2_10420 [Chloroflexota bacterium]